MPLDPNEDIPFSLKARQINHVIGVLNATLSETLDVIRTLSAQAQAYEQERERPTVVAVEKPAEGYSGAVLTEPAPSSRQRRATG
jgi:hypothetical protein